MSSLLLLPSFLFLFFSSQLCEGRHLFMAFDDVVDHGSKMTKTYDLSYENENSALVRAENRPEGELTRGKPDERTTEHGKHTVEGGKRRAAEGVQKTDSMISGLVVRIKFLSTAPWSVPRKGHAEPGFHLDYAPPKIHPPSHN
ncbi:hypothetical protein EJ110_NYTH32322 [Nymphaea thermarum]|nr:hypothetical protein EJ110_NYTH32322 [Nymphaea thermarum]